MLKRSYQRIAGTRQRRFHTGGLGATPARRRQPTRRHHQQVRSRNPHRPELRYLELRRSHRRAGTPPQSALRHRRRSCKSRHGSTAAGRAITCASTPWPSTTATSIRERSNGVRTRPVTCTVTRAAGRGKTAAAPTKAIPSRRWQSSGANSTPVLPAIRPAAPRWRIRRISIPAALSTATREMQPGSTAGVWKAPTPSPVWPCTTANSTPFRCTAKAFFATWAGKSGNTAARPAAA